MSIPPFTGSVSFNAHHSPMGAYCSFTCGNFSTRGGLAAQLGKPAGQDLFIGVKLGGRYDKGPIRCLPFFSGAQALMQDAQLAFTLEKPDGQTDALAAYSGPEIARHYGWATDFWRTADLDFCIRTPFGSIPDPSTCAGDPSAAGSARLKQALLPAVTAELRIDNRTGTSPMTGFFAINFHEGGARLLDEGLKAGRRGFALRGHTGVAAEAIDADSGAPVEIFSIMRWSVQQGLEDKSNPVHLLGSHPGLAVEVPAGRSVILRLALGCYLEGVVTTRLEGRYLYTRHYGNLVDVLNTTLDRFPELAAQSTALDAQLLASDLSANQQFLIAHATRSYYGNTQLLDLAPPQSPAEPYWIVNEGEYCMMNTLDLSVDQMFWELEYNPWVVRNLLDGFVKRYSYRDQVKVGPKGELAPGGISFAHDQGVHNQFSPFGTSSYELKDLTGCFSYMTQEQLCNWVLMSASYVSSTGDLEWVQKSMPVIHACSSSLHARDSLTVDGRTGIMNYDSVRTGCGSEITTYDSLDASLGQSRKNLYLAVKCWAARLAFARMAGAIGDLDTKYVQDQAAYLSAHSVKSQLQPDGVIPAIFGNQGPGNPSHILAAIEALIYPLRWLTLETLKPFGVYADFLSALRTHTVTLLSDPDRRNHFPDGGIRLSSTSDNSWLSKIAIVQHVARSLFNLDENGKDRPKNAPPASGWEKADAAHVRWLTTGESAFWAASDQMVSGTAKGSRYYPRLITAALWLKP